MKCYAVSYEIGPIKLMKAFKNSCITVFDSRKKAMECVKEAYPFHILKVFKVELNEIKSNNHSKV